MGLPTLSHAHLLYHTARRSNRLLKSPDSLPLSLEYLFAIHTARDDEEDELAIGSIFSLAEGLHLQFCRRKRETLLAWMSLTAHLLRMLKILRCVLRRLILLGILKILQIVHYPWDKMKILR
ncbi:uncharacterized protein LOC114307486 [Camellia sinensis]|uniref:uncharacterized protein LOC114271093 n=1 Tax=Camellia sinensis TaxID=4442 RepID=UPI0010363A4E|nr:uncharacterized protein LOC114271093 [Camellia sinensis]XP_028108688.1 uncharacterized protein LOC114307486 [Camellia sinensis]